MIEQLIKFAQKNHPGFAGMPDDILRKLFKTYEKTTLVRVRDGEIRGFALYQEWPDRLVFIAIAGIGSTIETINGLLEGRNHLPAKMICWFDETEMELKTICHP